MITAARPPLRLLPALTGALAITLTVFAFMQNLISRSQSPDTPLALHQNVSIIEFRKEPAPQAKPPEPADSAAQPGAQPVLRPLEPATVTPAPMAIDAVAIPDPAFDLDPGAIPVAGGNWSAPLSGGEAGLGGGRDANGYIRVVPFDTRRPNVPEVAWQNKINGWVLVAFALDSDGRTRDVRVLDASPRGVFEEAVIGAVKDWRYSLSVKDRHGGNIILTQRVEILWENYPNNLPNVD